MNHSDHNSHSLQFYTVENVATILKVTERTIYEYISSRKLDAYKIGKHYRIKPTDLEKFIEESKCA